jgi:hypothetical protein
MSLAVVNHARRDMPEQLSDELKLVLQACVSIEKSENGEFSYKWLRLSGYTFHHSKLKQLAALGYLAVQYNGIIRRGKAYYRVVRES